jgi:hypothetical protein
MTTNRDYYPVAAQFEDDFKKFLKESFGEAPHPEFNLEELFEKAKSYILEYEHGTAEPSDLLGWHTAALDAETQAHFRQACLKVIGLILFDFLICLHIDTDLN